MHHTIRYLALVVPLTYLPQISMRIMLASSHPLSCHAYGKRIFIPDRVTLKKFSTIEQAVAWIK
jgi:hypothetical protein